jgi:hypothetical protein
VNQFGAELIFKSGDLFADGRLTDSTFLCDRGEALFFNYSDKQMYRAEPFRATSPKTVASTSQASAEWVSSAAETSTCPVRTVPREMVVAALPRRFIPLEADFDIIVIQRLTRLAEQQSALFTF